jgi:uncharacterized protein YutE (UPF0331/DUF86 family)
MGLPPVDRPRFRAPQARDASRALERSRRRRPVSVDVLRKDVDLQDALAMSLLVAIQEAVDIAFHIAADEGWGVPGLLC